MESVKWGAHMDFWSTDKEIYTFTCSKRTGSGIYLNCFQNVLNWFHTASKSLTNNVKPHDW